MNNFVPDSQKKVFIVPYKDKDFQVQDTEIGPFGLPVNPESYSRTLQVKYDKRRGQGQMGSNLKFKSAPPEELKLEFIFDGTGVIENYHYNLKEKEKDPQQAKTVETQICRLLKTVYTIDGNTHQPRKIKIFWGTLAFECLLTKLDIKYTLFNDEGKPLRAKANATFLEYLSENKREKEAQKCSPDLTHRRQVKAADRLDLMVYEIYSDPKYVLQVAIANELTTFRSLPIGRELVLPPLDKTEV